MISLRRSRKMIGGSKVAYFFIVFFPLLLSADEISGDIISSLNESNKEVNRYYDNKIVSYRCVLTGNDNSFNCLDEGVNIYDMYEASRFDVTLNKRNSLEKIVFMEVSGVGKKKFLEYEDKTEKMCVRNVKCESMNLDDGSTIEKSFDIMFVLHGGTEVTKDTVLVGYSEVDGKVGGSTHK